MHCFHGTKAAAIDACTQKCKEDWGTREDGLFSNKVYIWGGSDHRGPYASNFLYENGGTGHCDLIENEVTELTNPYSCLGQGSILPDWDGSTPFTGFLATVMFTGVDGGSTSQANIRGYLAFKVENCGTTTCALVIDALEASAQDVTGIYTDPTGAQSSYTIEGLEMRITKRIEGQWHMTRGSVVFPTSVAVGKVWSRSTTIDSTTVPGDVSRFEIDQIAGSYRNGVLSLGFTQTQGSSATSVTLSTQ